MIKKKIISFGFLLVLVFSLVFTTTKVWAQSTNPLDSASIGYTMTPTNPAPGDNTTIQLSSSDFDLNTSIVRWYLNGNIVQQGQAETSFTFTVGALGSADTVKIDVVTSSGDVRERIITIAPEQLAVVWEGETYTPPFYKGKSLFSYGSTVRLVALPDFPGYKPSDLIYTWRKNTTVLEDQNGLGKNIVEINTGIILSPFVVIVTVTSPDGSYSASQTVSLQPAPPKIVLYEDHPTLGTLFETALPGVVVTNESEINVSAMPYFFSVDNRYSPDLVTSWAVNSQNVPRANNQPYVTAKASDSGSSGATLEVSMGTVGQILQFTNQSVSITFNKAVQ